MPSYYSDPSFQDKLLAHVARDKTLLKEVGTLLTPDDFKPAVAANGNGSGWSRWVVSKLALDYWERYRTPVRKLLRSEVLDYAHKMRLGPRQSKSLLEYADFLAEQTLEASESLKDKVLEYKCERARLDAVEQIVDLTQQGKMTNEKWYEICHNALEAFDKNGFHAVDFLAKDEMLARMRRRARAEHEDLPVLFIDPLDARIHTIYRKQIGVWLAPPGRGKSLACNHTSLVYAMQGYHAVLVECEDPKPIVEDRIDAAMTRLPLGMLRKKSSAFQQRWRNVRRFIRGNLTILDATDDRCTFAWLEKQLEELKERGKPADVLIIDYDDEVQSPIKNRDRHDLEIDESYRRFRRLAAKWDLFLWLAAQTKSSRAKKKILTDDDVGDAPAAKLRKCALMIGIGNGSEMGDDVYYLNVIKNKTGRKGFGVAITNDEDRGIFYDRDKTRALYERLESERAEQTEEADA